MDVRTQDVAESGMGAVSKMRPLILKNCANNSEFCRSTSGCSVGLFELLARAGFVEARGDGFLVVVGPDDALPGSMPEDVEEFADEMLSKYPHGETEIGLFRRCAGALIDTLRGDADPLTLLFGSGSPERGRFVSEITRCGCG